MGDVIRLRDDHCILCGREAFLFLDANAWFCTDHYADGFTYLIRQEPPMPHHTHPPNERGDDD